MGRHDGDLDVRRPLPPGTEARLTGFTELAAHRDRERPGGRGAARVRRGAGGAAAGGHPGGPGGAAGGGVRGGRRGGRATAPRRRHPHEPLRSGRRGYCRRRVGRRRRHARAPRHPVGPGGRDLHTLVFQSGRPARIDDYGDASAAAAGIARDVGRPLGGRRAGQRRGQAVGRDRHSVRARAAGRHRGAAGRVHRAGRHRDRQRRDAGRTGRLPRADRGHHRPGASSDRARSA